MTGRIDHSAKHTSAGLQQRYGDLSYLLATNGAYFRENMMWCAYDAAREKPDRVARKPVGR